MEKKKETSNARGEKRRTRGLIRLGLLNSVDSSAQQRSAKALITDILIIARGTGTPTQNRGGVQSVI